MYGDAEIAPGRIIVLDSPYQGLDFYGSFPSREKGPGRPRSEIKEVYSGLGNVAMDGRFSDRKVMMDSSERYLKPESEKEHSASANKRRFEVVPADVLPHDGIGDLKPFDFGLQILDLRVGREWKKEEAA